MMRIRPISLIIISLALGIFVAASGEVIHAQEVKSILSIEAYDMLNTVPDTYLVDVRTRAEYQFVGHPNKAYHFPYLFFSNTFSKQNGTYGYELSAKNKTFVEDVSKTFKHTDNLLLISKDGSRSALAAKDLIEAGFKNVFDVTDGFEGAEFPTYKDKNRHKYFRQLAKKNAVPGFGHRRHYGWQWWGLPWTYEMDPKFIYPPDLAKPTKPEKK
jgi:rhodanese-related sulfurtransferase